MTTSGAPDIEIAALDRTAIVFEPWSWRFTSDRRGDIDRYFAEVQRRRPGVWNGRILLLQRYVIAGAVLHGACFEADYASFCAWRDWKFPDTGIHNVFAAAALRSADGAFVVGEMAQSTANAGLLTFPSGTPELADLDAGGSLDLAVNLSRELMEETGLAVVELNPEPGWTMVRDGCYLALVKRLTSPQNAETLRARIMASIAGQERPEFTAVRIVRSPADFEPAMPRFVKAYLSGVWS